MNIPDIPPQQIKRKLGLPVMPLLPLLVMKLQGWTDHRASPRTDFQAKQHVDVDDNKELLDIPCRTGTRIGSKSLYWLPSDSIQAARVRVYKFILEFPYTEDQWDFLGLGGVAL